MKEKIFDITALLSKGETNAVSASTLARMLDWHQRDVTWCVNALRKQGVIICSGVEGFWLPESDEDVKRFARGFRARISDMEKALKPAEDYVKKIGEVDKWRECEQ